MPALGVNVRVIVAPPDVCVTVAPAGPGETVTPNKASYWEPPSAEDPRGAGCVIDALVARTHRRHQQRHCKRRKLLMSPPARYGANRMRTTSGSAMFAKSPRDTLLFAMSEKGGAGDVTLWLERWSDGDSAALDRLAPLVYNQLRKIADGLLHNERAGHTLQATALVHETFRPVIGSSEGRTRRSRALLHFFRQADAAHPRRSRPQMENGKTRRAFRSRPSEHRAGLARPGKEEVLDLSAALEELEALDAPKARAVELHYFLGCTVGETATLLGVSPSSVDRSLRFSLAWLYARLHRQD